MIPKEGKKSVFIQLLRSTSEHTDGCERANYMQETELQCTAGYYIHAAFTIVIESAAIDSIANLNQMTGRIIDHINIIFVTRKK